MSPFEVYNSILMTEMGSYCHPQSSVICTEHWFALEIEVNMDTRALFPTKFCVMLRRIVRVTLEVAARSSKNRTSEGLHKNHNWIQMWVNILWFGSFGIYHQFLRF